MRLTRRYVLKSTVAAASAASIYSVSAVASQDFCLEAHGKLFFFIQDFAHRAGEPASAGFRGPGPRHFANVQRELSSVRWLDNDETLVVQQEDDGAITIQATGFPPGTNTDVRVAVAN